MLSLQLRPPGRVECSRARACGWGAAAICMAAGPLSLQYSGCACNVPAAIGSGSGIDEVVVVPAAPAVPRPQLMCAAAPALPHGRCSGKQLMRIWTRDTPLVCGGFCSPSYMYGMLGDETRAQGRAQHIITRVRSEQSSCEKDQGASRGLQGKLLGPRLCACLRRCRPSTRQPDQHKWGPRVHAPTSVCPLTLRRGLTIGHCGCTTHA